MATIRKKSTQKMTKMTSLLLPLKKKKGFSSFRPMIRSRHPSHRPLRKDLSLLPFRSVVRLGSTWPGDGKPRTECNSVDAIRTSASKFLMKTAFEANQVKTALWLNGAATEVRFTDWIGKVGYPIVAKHVHGSRGEGNTLIQSAEELAQWRRGKTITNYIFEKFYNFSREYRLHVTKDGCFYTCRKMLKEGTPEEERWYRNDSNCVWVLETNSDFDKPTNWNSIVAESVKALKAVGLDIGAIDVKVQSAKTTEGKVRKAPEFIILETNSAPSFGEITLQKYLTEIPKILRSKFVG